jgi:hypothetical protein
MWLKKDPSLKQIEEAVSAMPTYVYFADEQDTRDSMLFGGVLVHRQKLADLDDGIAKIKESVGLAERNPIKWSPSDSDAYAAQRNLSHENRRDLRERVLSLLEKIEATSFFSLVWKFDKGFTADAYKWAFQNVLQRLIITVERKAKATKVIWYPGLDVVVDWFPQPSRRREFLSIYDDAYHDGYMFDKNRLPPLKELNACPCLLVTSCQFSPGLQLADFTVGSIGRLFRWAYKRDGDPVSVIPLVRPTVETLLRINNEVIGYGLVLPTTGAARRKVNEALAALGF